MDLLALLPDRADAVGSLEFYFKQEFYFSVGIQRTRRYDKDRNFLLHL